MCVASREGCAVLTLEVRLGGERDWVGAGGRVPALLAQVRLAALRFGAPQPRRAEAPSRGARQLRGLETAAVGAQGALHVARKVTTE